MGVVPNHVTMSTLFAAGPQGLSVGVSFSGDFSVLMMSISIHCKCQSQIWSKLASYEKYLSVRFEPIRNREMF